MSEDGFKLAQHGINEAFNNRNPFLDLSDLGLTTVPAAAFELPFVTRIDLSSNKLTDLSDGIAGMRRLASISLRGNKFRVVPLSLLRCHRLIVMDLSENDLDVLPPSMAGLRSLVELRVHDNHLLDVPDEILKLPRLRRLIAFGNDFDNQAMHEAAEQTRHDPGALLQLFRQFDDLPRESTAVSAPPVIPPQSVGLHFSFDEKGVVNFAPPRDLDTEGNNTKRLRTLQPELISLAQDLLQNLKVGNQPHAPLLSLRVEKYLSVIDRNLSEINFSLLYVEGVRLANAADALNSAILSNELPSVPSGTQEALSSLLAIHAPFVLATVEGQDALAAEQNYRLRPNERREYKNTLLEYARVLQDEPSIIAPAVAEAVKAAAEQVGEGKTWSAEAS